MAILDLPLYVKTASQSHVIIPINSHMANNRDRIDRLKKSLYRRDPSGTSYKRHRFRRDDEDAPEEWEGVNKQSSRRTPHDDDDEGAGTWLKIFVGIGVTVFVLALGFAAFRIFQGLNVVDSKKVAVEVDGPVSINGGDEMELDIAVTNNNETALESATLIIEYPSGARVADNVEKELERYTHALGSISQGATVEHSHSSVLFGKKDSIKDIVIRVEYRIEGSNANFSKKEETYPVKITSSPLNMKVDNPTEVNSGRETEFTVTLVSNSNKPMEDVLLRAEYPFGFEFESASPEPRFRDNVWRVGTLEPGEKRVINILGRLEGQENEERTFRFHAGEADADREREIAVEFIRTQKTLTIERPFVALGLSVNGNDGRSHVTSMGEQNQVDVQWESNLDSALVNAQVVVRLSGDSLDQQSVSVGSGGFYRSVDNTVTWTKNDNPELQKVEPGDNGRVSFSFRTVEPSPSVISRFTNPEIDIEVQLVGDRFTQSGGTAESVTSDIQGAVKARAELSLTSRMVHTTGVFENSGPIPPEAERETTYTALWTITNAFNDIENGEVRASLPSYVEWKGKVDPSDEHIRFIPDTREIVWQPGHINAGVGFLEPAHKVAFQVGFLPSKGQVGTSPIIVNNVRATGRDAFVSTVLQFSKSPLTTEIATDPSFERGDAQVQSAR